MPEYFEVTVDKFTFRVAKDRLYTREGIWAKPEGNLIRVGLSDFVQQRSGDVAFAEVMPEGSSLHTWDEFAHIETIKEDISLASPVSGKIIAVNLEMTTAPEAINQDPYGAGWLAVFEATAWEADRAPLLDPETYFTQVKVEAEREAKK